MATRGLTTWRPERSVSMPACGLGLESTAPSVLLAVPARGVFVDGFGRRIDAQYAGKPAHNLVGVPSS